MNQAEKDKIKSYVRKLARIATELNELAFNMADFEGAEYKQFSNPHITPKAEPDHHVDQYVAPLLTKNSQYLEEKIKSIEALIEKEKDPKAQLQLKKKKSALLGHLTRARQAGNVEKEGVWKSRVK